MPKAERKRVEPDWRDLAERLAKELLDTQKRCRLCADDGGAVCDHCCATAALLIEAGKLGLL